MFTNRELALAHQVAGLAIWEWSARTDSMHWFEGSCALFGRPTNELQTRADVLQCVAPEDRERISKIRDLAVSTHGRYHAEYRVIWPNGNVRWISAAAIVVEDSERGTILLGVSQDITDTKRTEEQLKKQAEKLRAQARLLDLAYEPILVRDNADRISYWNEGAQRLYGYSRAEAVGLISHEL